MSRRLRVVRASAAGLLLAALAAAGCFSRIEPQRLERNRFLLAPVRGVDPSPSGVGRLRVERPAVASLFAQKGFTYRTGESTYDNDFYNEFFAPPGTVVQSALVSWLRESGRFAEVGGDGLLDPDWILTGRVEQLYADLRSGGAPRAILELELRLVDARVPSRDVVFAARYRREEQAGEASGRAIVDAWSRALADVATELEGDLARRLALGPAGGAAAR